LKRSLAKGASWTAILQVSQRGLEILFTAILARLLEPADFGVVTAGLLLVQFAQLFVEIGIGATVIQMPRLDLRDIRAANTLVVLSALFYFLVVEALAPSFAAFMQIEQVTQVVRILGFIFLIQAGGVVSESLLLRRLEARTVAALQLGAKIGGTGLVGIPLALLGWGYWALVVALLTEAFFRAVAAFAIVRPPVRPLLKRELTNRLLRSGSGYSLSRLLNFAATRADNLLVGRYLSAAALGLYSRAYALMSAPADLYGTVADRVVFPAMALIQDDRTRLHRAFLEGTELTALVGISASALLYLLSNQIIDLVLGDKWHAVIVPFGILAAATYFRLGAKVAGSVQRARRALRAMIFTQALYALLVVGGCLASYRYGIVWVSAAVSASVVIFYIVIITSAARLVDASTSQFAKAHLPGIKLGLLSATLCWVTLRLGDYLRLDTLPMLILEGCILGTAALGISLLRPAWLIGKLGSASLGAIQARAVVLFSRPKPLGD